MQEAYERTNLVITAFDVEDVITTSGFSDGGSVNPEDNISVDYGTEEPFGFFW